MSKKKKTKRENTARPKTQPRELERLIDHSMRQLVAADYNGFIATAEQILRHPSASPAQRAETCAYLGGVYMQLDKHEQAFAAVNAAIKFAPNNPLHWYNLGITARYTTRFGLSQRAFEHAATLDHRGELADKLAKDIPFAHSLADTERKLRGPDFTLDQLIEQEEQFQQAVKVMAQHRWAEAAELFRQNIALGDALPQPWGNLGICLVMQRQFDAGEAALRRALEIEPEYAIARQNLAGLPAIRATGKLPMMHINTAFTDDSVDAKVRRPLFIEGRKG